jgi:chromosome segregation ATPase
MESEPHDEIEGRDDGAPPPASTQESRRTFRVLSTDSERSEVSAEVLERRRQLLSTRERGLDERASELDRREVELDERQAALDVSVAENEIAIAIERDALAGRAEELNELAERLARKEAQVADFVTQAQRHLAAATPRSPEPPPDRKRSWRLDKSGRQD